MEAAEFFGQIRIPATVAHVVAVVFGMGAALVSDVLFSFFSKDKRLTRTEISVLSVLARIVTISLVVIALSGVVIFFSDSAKYLASTKFMAKMSILGVLVINGYVLHRYIWPHLLNKSFFFAKRERFARVTAFLCGAISVVSWLSVCVLGVLDGVPYAYGTIMALYVGILLVAMAVAVLIEQREFSS